jgi:hypothetical protein
MKLLITQKGTINYEGAPMNPRLALAYLTKIYRTLKFLSNGYWSAEEKMQLASFKNIPLTPSEKKEIRTVWGNIDLTYHKMMKSICGFNPLFCSRQYFNGKIMHLLNPLEAINGLRDKCLYDNYKHEIRFPATIVKNVNDVFIKDGNVVTLDDAVEICSQEPEFIIKPSVESSGGKNVLKIISENNEEIRALFIRYTKNFIIQKVVRQSASTAKFNPSSLNTFRIITLFLNGKCTILSRILRFGVSGAVIDNAAGGGYFLGIKPDGRLSEFAINKKLEKITDINDCIFVQMQVPNFYTIENFALEKHIKLFPNIGMVGWDLALDSEENIVCIEYNVGYYPWVLGFEFSCGPFFGDRTHEVIDYVKKHPII